MVLKNYTEDKISQEIEEILSNSNRGSKPFSVKLIIIGIVILLTAFIYKNLLIFLPESISLLIGFVLIISEIIFFSIFTHFGSKFRRSKIKQDENYIRKNIVEPVVRKRISSFVYDVNVNLPGDEREIILNSIAVRHSGSDSSSKASFLSGEYAIDVYDLDAYHPVDAFPEESSGPVRVFMSYIVKIRFKDKKPESIVRNRVFVKSFNYIIYNDCLYVILSRNPSKNLLLSNKTIAEKWVRLFLNTNELPNRIEHDEITDEFMSELISNV